MPVAPAADRPACRGNTLTLRGGGQKRDRSREVDVLVAGAGPVGLTAAAELRRRGVETRIVDRLAEPRQYAKAVGIQPRTLEVWEDMGVLLPALDAAIELRGQIRFVNGEEASRIELTLPREIPYRFMGLPQYETERVLR
jgi:2-polyprenyl-6-methoxyphenol hydroxylase-like FAD-dependent oxidoreductase